MADLIDRNALLKEYCADCNSSIDKPCPIPGRCHEYGLIKNFPVVNRWIPCSERMPEIDTDVLVYAVRKDGLGDAVTTITKYINYIWFVHKVDTEPYWKDPWQYFHSDYEITHWIPLPEPPKDDET